MTVSLMDRMRGVTRVQADEQIVLRILREDGPQDRRILAQRLHVSDRAMRRAIDQARRDGELVLFDREAGMYRMARDRADFDHWVVCEQQSRLTALHLQLSAMTKTADRRWPTEARYVRSVRPRETSRDQLRLTGLGA